MQKPQKEKAFPFTLRLTASERKILERKAAGETLGEYIRRKALGDNRAKRSPRGLQPLNGDPTLAKLLVELGKTRIASNVSQLVTAIDRGYVKLPKQVHVALHQAQDDLSGIKASLLQAQKRTRSKDQPSLIKLLNQIKATSLGCNLNDLAKASNSGSLALSPETTTTILEACADIREIRETLDQSLRG